MLLPRRGVALEVNLNSYKTKKRQLILGHLAIKACTGFAWIVYSISPRVFSGAESEENWMLICLSESEVENSREKFV